MLVVVCLVVCLLGLKGCQTARTSTREMESIGMETMGHTKTLGIKTALLPIVASVVVARDRTDRPSLIIVRSPGCWDETGAIAAA